MAMVNVAGQDVGGILMTGFTNRVKILRSAAPISANTKRQSVRSQSYFYKAGWQWLWPHLILRNSPNSSTRMIRPMVRFAVASVRHAICFGVLMVIMMGLVTMALAESWGAHVPNAEIVGKARLKVFLFKIYDATLYAPQGRYDPDGVFALQLHYLVDASKAQIVKRSLSEMRRQTQADEAQLQIWKGFLDDSFRDLKDGESATAIHNSDGSITFYLNDTESKTIKDADFADAFMNIWLSDSARDPNFSRVLRGLDGQS